MPDDSEQEITCEFLHTRGLRGARGSCGEPIEPGDPDETELIEAYFTDSHEPVELTDDEYATAMEKL